MQISQKNKISIIIVTFVIPYPANDGGKVYCYGYINQLRHKMDITLILKVNSKEQLGHAEDLKKIWSEVTIYIINLIEENEKKNWFSYSFKKVKRKLIYLLDTPKNKVKHFSWKTLINQDWQNLEEKIIVELKNILSSSCYDLIQIEHTTNISLINILPSNAKKIFVEIESFYLISRDKLRAVGKEGDIYATYLLEKNRLQEYSFMKLYDAVFALNKNDFLRISQIFNKRSSQIFLSPFGVLDSVKLSPEIIVKYSPEKIIFLGSEIHEPNVDAVKWFSKEVFPKLLKKYPNISFQITGSWSIQTKKLFKDQSQIIFTGFINDLSEFLINSIMVVPIRLGGGGMRAKVLDGLANGCPIVSTYLGCEGFEVANDAIKIADTPEDFVNTISLIIDNPQIGREMIINGSKVVRENFDFENLANERLQYYHEILGHESGS